MSLDPTRSITLRKQFTSEGVRRYGRFVREAGSRSNPTAPLFGEHGSLEQDLRRILEQSFMIQAFDQYPIQGYVKGVRTAFSEVRKAEYVQLTPPAFSEFTKQVTGSENARRNLSQLMGRFRLELGGVNEVVLTAILRELARHEQGSLSRADITRVLNEQVNKIGKLRFTILAHDTIIRAHAEGQLDAFQALGIHRLQSVPELTSVTAGDTRVCSLCRDVLVVKMEDAHNLLPRHARCRCRWGLLEVDRKLLQNRRLRKPVLERTAL